MEYFYTPPKLISPSELIIEGDEFAHLTHVMRKTIGDSIRVVDGVGTAYDVTITGIDKPHRGKRSAQCKITGVRKRLHEPDIDVTLGVGILKNLSRFDFLVEKVTELGVNTIVPLLTARTIPRHAKVERWQKLALAAMKQSGRCVLPVIGELTSFKEFVTSAPTDCLKLVLHEQSSQTISSHLEGKSHKSFTLCIGPEGGFADDEITYAAGEGFVAVSLGQTRLRTETAAIAAAVRALQ